MAAYIQCPKCGDIQFECMCEHLHDDSDAPNSLPADSADWPFVCFNCRQISRAGDWKIIPVRELPLWMRVKRRLVPIWQWFCELFGVVV